MQTELAGPQDINAQNPEYQVLNTLTAEITVNPHAPGFCSLPMNRTHTHSEAPSLVGMSIPNTRTARPHPRPPPRSHALLIL